MIKVEEISKKFQDIQAVNELSFEIQAGEIVGLLGPNGAGKSTTMRMMSGYLSPDKGKVVIDNISVDEDPISAQKKIGYLPENNPLYFDMVVSDLLKYSALLKGIKKSELKSSLDFVVSSVNIKDVFYRTVGELSKGFKQRVGLAIALLHKPEILILDEPTEGLDPNQRAEIRKLIKDLAKDHTVVISTHVMQEVEALCSRMIIINNGIKVADGSVDDLTAGARNEKIIIAKIQGSNIQEKVKEMKNVKSIDVRGLDKEMYQVTLVTDLNVSVQPELSGLCSRNNWVIWELIEQKQQLEDVFKKLTENV